jgi:hypothetical protein
MSKNQRSKRGGPKTPEGKARSSLNALKHGRYARSIFVLRHEDHIAFERLVESLARVLLPQNDVEYNLVRQLASIEWRLQRILLIDSSILDQEFAASQETLRQHGASAPEGFQLGFTTHRLLENSRLPHYLATRESQLVYARSSLLATLRELRRGGTPAPKSGQIIEPIDINRKSSFQNEPGTNPPPPRPQVKEHTPDTPESPNPVEP